MTRFIFKSCSLTSNEIQSAANIHHKYLNTSFLSQLGLSFLFYLYKAINECSGTELIVAKDGDDVIGFITGASSLRSVYLHLIKHNFIQATLSILPHLFSFSKVKKILEILSYTNNNDQDKEAPTTELLSLAVKDDYRRDGVAMDLFKQLVIQFKNKGLTEFKIIVGEELIGAQRFYEKMGAVVIDSVELHKGLRSIIYKVEIK